MVAQKVLMGECKAESNTLRVGTDAYVNVRLKSGKPSDRLSFFDYIVYSAICTMSDNTDGDKYFDAVSIAKIITGSTSAQESALAKAINESINRLRTTRICIGYLRQADGWHGWVPNDVFNGANNCVAGDNLIAAKKIKGIKVPHGKTRNGYKLLREPILLSYSKACNREITTVYIPAYTVARTKKNAIIYDYIMFRITRMKKGVEKDNRTIKMNSVYSMVGPKNPVEKKRIREICSEILNSMCENDIAGYNFNIRKTGNSIIDSITIDI